MQYIVKFHIRYYTLHGSVKVKERIAENTVQFVNKRKVRLVILRESVIDW